jgi:hypothetical protein
VQAVREFASLLEAGIYVGTVLAAEVVNQARALDHAAAVVQTEAKAIIGHYQAAAGPFAPWAELADATKEQRVRLGFSENEPLLRTGEMRDSILRTVIDGSHAAVGSDNDKMVWQELGTPTIPPRSALGIAAIHKIPQVAHILGQGVTEALVGRKVFGGAIPL